jgi:hypothetical protein
VLREQATQHGTGVRIDEMDLGEVPNGEANFQQAEMPGKRRGSNL